ncbi:MAG: LamG-like jellyroll fold domain-containing protein [Saprospiraceae bacterium]
MKKLPLKHYLIIVFLFCSICIYLGGRHWSAQQEHQSHTLVTKMPKAERMAAEAAYFNQMYKDPRTGIVPSEQAVLKQQLYKKLQAQLQERGNHSNLFWEDAGPNNVGGRTRAIALDRRDSKVIITGGVRGGIWKSTDDGVTWKHIPGLIANESIMSIAQDPVEPDQWYAVTGEYVGAGANFFGGGIYHSIDNGESWELQQYQLDTDPTISVHNYYPLTENNLGGNLPIFCGEPCDLNPFIYSTKVVVSPTTQSVFVATNNYGIKKSSDTLESFQHSLPASLNIPGGMVAVAPLSIDAFTNLLLSFEGNLTDSLGHIPISTNNINFAEGVHGLGTDMNQTGQFIFPKEGVIDGREGSIEFWFKPDWESFTSNEHDFVLVGNFPDAIFIHHIESRFEMIHTAGDLPGQSWAVVGGNTDHWKKGEWRHLAFTWGGSELAFYENGVLVAKQVMSYTLPEISGMNIQFGRELGGSIDGIIDELRVSNKARSHEKILETYLAGGIGAKPNADPIQRPLWSDVDVDKNGRLLAYLSGETTEGAGVYYSDNDGNSWINITPADWDLNSNRGLIRFAPSNPDVAYLLFNKFDFDGEGITFFKIDVPQKAFEDRSEHLPVFVGYPEPENDGFPLLAGQWTMQLDIKPDDENFVIAGGVQLVRSTDGFASSTDDLVKHHINSNSHVDNHIVVFDPEQPNTAWLGNDGGVFKTDNIKRESPSGTPFTNVQWQHKFKGYNVVTFYAMGLPGAPTDFRMIAGAQDRGTPVIDRANAVDPQASIGDPFGGDGGFSFLGKNHAYVYAAVGQSYRLKYDENGLPSFNAGFLGLTGALVNRAHDFINPFVVDLDDETAIYYPIQNKLLRYTKLDEQPEFAGLEATDWEEPPGLAGPDYSKITALELSVSPKDILYYAVQQEGERPYIYRLEDAENATSPTAINPITGAIPGSWVRCIAINPDNADEIVAVISSSNVPKLFHSLDGGSTFTNIDGNLANTTDLPGPHTNWLSILPYDGTVYYILATSIGVYVTQELNSDDTFWELQDPDLIGFASAQMVRSRLADGLIAVATYGRGIFIGGPGGPPTSTEEVFVKGETPFDIFPNPSFMGSTILRFELPTSQNISFKVSDMSGKVVLRGASKNFSPGVHKIILSTASFSHGVYVVELKAEHQRWAQKLVIAKR